MGTVVKKSLSWEIDNFSERKNAMSSDQFSSGGCKWYVTVHPEGFLGYDHLYLFLRVGDPDPLKVGWKRRAMYCFFLLNQSGEKLYTSPGKGKVDEQEKLIDEQEKLIDLLYLTGQIRMFCNEASSWGVRTTVPLAKLQEKGFLENNKLTIQVYMKVAEVVHQGKSTANDLLDFGRFQIIASQAYPFAETITQHPDFAVGVIGMNQALKTAHMDLLLGLIETLSKSPQNLSVAELSSAQSQFTELTEAGFKLDWLKPKLKEVSLERKKALPDGSSVQELEERVNKLELTQGGFLESKLKEVSLERKKALPDGSSKLKEVSLERKKALPDGSSVQELEERVNKLELTLCDLKVKLEEEEKIKSAAAPKLYSFEFIDFFITRIFLSCFSISKH